MSMQTNNQTYIQINKINKRIKNRQIHKQTNKQNKIISITNKRISSQMNKQTK